MLLNVIAYCAGAVRKNLSASTADKKEVERLVSKWLTGARDRDGKREERRKIDGAKKSNRKDTHQDMDVYELSTEEDERNDDADADSS